MSEERKYRMVHIKIEEELHNKIWEITKKRYIIPTKKFHIILNEVLRKGIEQIEKEEPK